MARHLPWVARETLSPELKDWIRTRSKNFSSGWMETIRQKDSRIRLQKWAGGNPPLKGWPTAVCFHSRWERSVCLPLWQVRGHPDPPHRRHPYGWTERSCKSPSWSWNAETLRSPSRRARKRENSCWVPESHQGTNQRCYHHDPRWEAHQGCHRCCGNLRQRPQWGSKPTSDKFAGRWAQRSFKGSSGSYLLQGADHPRFWPAVRKAPLWTDSSPLALTAGLPLALDWSALAANCFWWQSPWVARWSADLRCAIAPHGPFLEPLARLAVPSPKQK